MGRHRSVCVRPHGSEKKTFPAMRDAEPRETKGFELALQRGFEFIARDGRLELRRRVKTVNETVCEGIAD